MLEKEKDLNCKLRHMVIWAIHPISSAFSHYKAKLIHWQLSWIIALGLVVYNELEDEDEVRFFLRERLPLVESSVMSFCEEKVDLLIVCK